MDELYSRSEKKRRAKDVENLAQELFALSAKHIAALPCDKTVKDQIVIGRSLKGGARKRQAKYIARLLRPEEEVTRQLLTYIENRKGSKLKEVGAFHQLEHLRDSIINDALAANAGQFAARWKEQPATRPADGGGGGALEAALRLFPDLPVAELQQAAVMYARTRKPVYSRELFRLLKAAWERKKLYGVK
jgi:ribosome-associated protein